MCALGMKLFACEVCRASECSEIGDSVLYNELYYILEMRKKLVKYWTCTGVISIGNRNSVNETETVQGLQYHLLCQSLVGLTNRAVEIGKSKMAVWLYDHSEKASYELSKLALENMNIREHGMRNGLELACENYERNDGMEVQLRSLFDGYVLTDVKNNPESGIVASVASHVYNSIIVDVRDEEYFEKAGYTLKYDATRKTTLDAWCEFKSQCNNDALVIMPVQTGELREFAIKNNLFVMNLNKRQGDARYGQNIALLDEVLAWLKPNAPVYGWEQGVREDQFVSRVSKSGHPMIPCDWSYSHSLTALLYTERQQLTPARVIDPRWIDYSKKRNYVSFFLSDGDNVHWMMQDFASRYYTVPEAGKVKMGYGLPVSTLAMMVPVQLGNLMSLQNPCCSILEMLGGGYYYVDTYNQNNNRRSNLNIVAELLATHMRRHNVRLLGVMAMDAKSAATKEVYQIYVDANDQLEGIIALQCSPYAGDEGDIWGVTNKAGYAIPVITVKYSIWDRTHEREGSSDFIATLLKDNMQDESFSAVCVHAWSSFEGGLWSNGGLAMRRKTG